MSYIERNLLPEEKILFVGRITPAIFLLPGAVSILSILVYIKAVEVLNSSTASSSFIGGLYLFTSFIAIFATIVLLIKSFIAISTSEFAVTNKRIIKKTGLISRKTKEIYLSHVESIGIDQGILGRIFNFGTIVIIGTGGTPNYMKSIIDPMKLRNRINAILECLKK